MDDGEALPEAFPAVLLITSDGSVVAQDGVPMVLSPRVGAIKLAHGVHGPGARLVPVTVELKEREVKWSEEELGGIIRRAIATGKVVRVRVDPDERQRLQYMLRHYWRKMAEGEGEGFPRIATRSANVNGVSYLLVQRVPTLTVEEDEDKDEGDAS